MIDTGGTIVKAAQALKAQGAERVIVAATHAVFSAPATERLQDSSIDEVVVTDTIPLPPRSASRGSRFCRSRRCSRAIKKSSRTARSRACSTAPPERLVPSSGRGADEMRPRRQ
jgi:phosphoribosylpyrophosphate synthetase